MSCYVTYIVISVCYSVRLGVFLRRYPVARVFVIIYMVSYRTAFLLVYMHLNYIFSVVVVAEFYYGNNCAVRRLKRLHVLSFCGILCYLRRRLASGEGIVLLVVCLSRCVCVRCISLDGERNALYPLLSSLLFLLSYVAAPWYCLYSTHQASFVSGNTGVWTVTAGFITNSSAIFILLYCM